MGSRRQLFGDQRGSILVGGLLLVLAVTLLGLGLFQAAVVETRQVAQTEEDARAFYAAETGLNRAALDVQYDTIGTKTFDFKNTLNGDYVTASSFYATTCFGGDVCDSAHATIPAYVVDAVNNADANMYWLVSTACVPGPAANPCPAGTKAAAQVKALIKRTLTTTTETSTTTTTTTTNRPAFTWGGFGGTSLKFSGNCHGTPCTTADTYNSRSCGSPPCPYGGANALLTSGKFGSNGSVDIGNPGGHDVVNFWGNVIGTTNVSADPTDLGINGPNAVVHGNVESGGTVQVNGVNNPASTSQVTGTITPNTSTTQVQLTALDNCGPYTDLTGKVTQYTDNTYTTVVGSPTWKYGGVTGCGNCGVGGGKPGEFVAGGGAFIKFAPSTVPYCLSDVTFSGGTNVQVTGLTVFIVNGVFTLSGGGFANVTQDPQNLQLISTYGNAGIAGTNAVNDPAETKTGVTLSGGSDGYMTVYAPTTDVVVGGGGSIVGAVMGGKNVNFTGGSALHYDAYLGSGNANLVDISQPITVTTTTTVTTTIPGPTLWSLQSWQKVPCRPSGSAWTCGP
jgi:Tfp pilus assembly protein PilX